MADDFEEFKKRLKSGETKVLAIPPPVPPAGGFLKTAAQIAGRAAKPLVEAGAKRIRDLSESKTKPARAKATKPAGRTGGKGRSGTLSEKLESTRTRPRTEKEANKFGPIVKRQENMPAKQGSRAIVKREDKMPAKIEVGRRDLVVLREGKKGLQPYKPTGRSVAQTGTRTFGDKGQAGRIVGLSTKGKVAAAGLGAGAAALGYAAYKKADKASATAPRDDRSSSGGSAFNSEFGKKRQGQNVKGSPTNPATRSVKQAGDKSRLNKSAAPVKKLNNFERMKMRQLEKEGFGGRSMTSARAKARVLKERDYKFADLFKRKK